MKTKFTVKQILAVVLSLLMVLAVSIPAFAADGKIVIHNAEGLAAMAENQFTAYQIFTGTVKAGGSGTNGATGTMVDVEWSSATAGATLLGKIAANNVLADAFKTYLVEIGVAASKDAADISKMTAIQVAEVLERNTGNAFLQEFAILVAESGFTAITTGTVSNATNPKNDTYTFSGLAAGYYLVVQTSDIKNADGTNSVRSSHILQVVNGEVNVNLKADIPSVDKKVENNDHNTTAGIGDYVKFTLTATLPDNFSDYTKGYYLQFNDTLSSGLRMVIENPDYPFTVKCGENDLTGLTGYSTTAADEKTGSFTVTFTNLQHTDYTSKGIAAGATITVTYWAEILSTAANIENNEVNLTYSNNPNTTDKGDSVKDIVYVHNFNIDLTKEGTDGKLLDGAKFYLTKTVDNKTLYAVVSAGKITKWVEGTPDEDDKIGDDVVAILTANSGKIAIAGLDAGVEYTLHEVSAPTGYAVINDIKFTISATLSDDGSTVTNATVTITDSDTRTDVKDVTVAEPEEGEEKAANPTSTIKLLLIDPTESNVPNTGGIGTIIFYVMGGLMVLGAAAYLVISKKKAKA